MRKQDALFLAQAIPWLVLMLLWLLVAFVVLLITTPVKFAGWLIQQAARSVEAAFGMVLALLWALRPVAAPGGPQDPTATAPVTPGGAA